MTLKELEQRRAERTEPIDLTRTMPAPEVNDYLRGTNELEARLNVARQATADLARLQSIDDDLRWIAFLTESRAVLCRELMTIHSPIRDKTIKARFDDLTFGIRTMIDGYGRKIAPVVDLSDTSIGKLMTTAGYATSGPELHSPRGWRGSLPEVEHRVKLVTKERDAAQHRLADALLDDDARAKRDAEAAARRDVLNALRLQQVGEPLRLVPVDRNGMVIDLADLTEEQRAAVEHANAAFAG